ncbi:exodeoxyribonuclease III [Paracoccaceae bacterium GXU_MW_L88]
MKLATWNINSVRLREALVLDMLKEDAPDVLCLQETKSPVEKIPLEGFAELGYSHWVAAGQKGYNGVMILSKIPLAPLEDGSVPPICRESHARHIGARLENGITLHNVYIPAGGDEPDPEKNAKFAHKLDFLDRMKTWFAGQRPEKSIIVGDFNIAPREDDVWSHKQLLKVVSHTPIEVEAMTAMQDAGGWVDITRKHIPEGQLYSWWSYRARDWDAADKGRRLDHIWASGDLESASRSSWIKREWRGAEKPSDHVPVFAEFEV